MKNYLNNKKFIIAFSILLISIFFVTSCGTSYDNETSYNKDVKPKGDQSLYFTHKEDGKTIEYEVIFQNDKIVSLYRNGVKVSDSEMRDYEDIIYNKLNGMKKEIKQDEEGGFVFSEGSFRKFNSDEFKEKMKEFRNKFKEEEFKFRFDKEKFKVDMDKLKDELKNNEVVINLNKEKMKENMKELKEHLKELEFIKPEIDIDFDDLDDKMKEIKIRIKKGDEKIHKIEIEKLEKDMKKLKEEMGDLSIKMDNLETELEMLDNFLTALKKELVKDNLINSIEDDLELEMSADQMSVNGKEVTGSLFTKYKNMYENHFDKKLEGKKKFQIK